MVEKKNSVFGEIRTDRVLNSLKQQRILIYIVTSKSVNTLR